MIAPGSNPPNLPLHETVANRFEPGSATNRDKHNRLCSILPLADGRLQVDRHTISCQDKEKRSGGQAQLLYVRVGNLPSAIAYIRLDRT